VGKTTVARITVVAEDETASDEAARDLLGQLHEVDDILRVELSSRPGAPDGARSGELLAVGTLLLTLVAQPEVVTTVLTYVADWRRRQRRDQRVEVWIGDRALILTNASDAQADKIIDAFIGEGLDPDS
jgi:hypothetical protein